MSTALVFVDIETQGRNYLKNSLLAIGVSILDPDSGKTEKHLFKIQPEEKKDFEEECYLSFWMKNLDILEFLSDGARPLRECLSDFVDLITELEVTPTLFYCLIILSSISGFWNITCYLIARNHFIIISPLRVGIAQS